MEKKILNSINIYYLKIYLYVRNENLILFADHKYKF